MGTPNSVIQSLQKIQNVAARLVILAPRHHHSTPLLEKLHWLPISERIKYKVACMCFSAINGSCPAYLSLNWYMSTLRLVHYALLTARPNRLTMQPAACRGPFYLPPKGPPPGPFYLPPKVPAPSAPIAKVACKSLSSASATQN